VVAMRELQTSAVACPQKDRESVVRKRERALFLHTHTHTREGCCVKNFAKKKFLKNFADRHAKETNTLLHTQARVKAHIKNEDDK
jgi:hypothetical protein